MVAYAACPVPAGDAARVALLHSHDILDTPAEPAYDDLARLAAYVCGTPPAEVDLIDRDRQWTRAAARVAVLRDLTERRAAERVKNEFVSTVRREPRTPLASIRGALGLIDGGAAGAVSQRGLELVRIARATTERPVPLIDTILDVEKTEAGRMELGVTMIEPVDLLATTLDGAQGMAEQHRVRLVARVNTMAASAGDRDRVIEVLTNLLANAIRFSPADADVVVRVSAAPAGCIRFAVTDAGAGIAPEDVDGLFRKISQLDATNAHRRGGTRPALAISRAIVEQHGGQIGVRSTAGAGRGFWFELPHVATPPALRPAA